MSHCVLALDSATAACSAALWLDGRVLERFEHAGREHSRRLLPMLHGLLAEAGIVASQLDGVVCGIGPGSFSGLRIGVGIAKGLAFGLQLPVVGVSSLAMLAQGAIRERGAPRVLALVDAGRGEFYLASYAAGPDGRAIEQIAPQVSAPDRLPSFGAGPWWGVGNGWLVPGLAPAVAAQGFDADALPRSRDAITVGLPSLLDGSAQSASELAPLYLREQIALDLVQQRQRAAQKS